MVEFLLSAAAPSLATFLELGVVGEGILAVGAFAVGTYIDSQLLFPAIFKNDDRIRTPQVDDFQIQTGSEGSPIKTVYGYENRISGTVVYVSDVKKRLISVNGTKVSRVAVDIAVSISGNRTDRIDKIWANDKVLYDDTGDLDIDFTSHELIAAHHGTSAANQNPKPEDPLIHLSNFDFKIDLTRPGGILIPNDEFFDFTKMPTGQPIEEEFRVILSGWTNAGLNRDYYPIKTDRQDLPVNGGSSVLLHVWPDEDPTNPQLVTEDARPFGGGTANVRVQQKVTEIPRHIIATPPVFYYGAPGQTPDPTLVAVLGANAVSFKGMTYCMLKDVNLFDFGNRIPQFTFQVHESETDTTRKVYEVIENIIDGAGELTAADNLDVTALEASPEVLRGILYTKPNSAKERLQPVMIAFDLIATEEADRIVFRKRSEGTAIVVPRDDYAARQSGQRAPNKATIEDVSDLDLPREVNIQYTNPELDFRRGSARAQLNQVTSIGPVTLSKNNRIANIGLPVTLTPDEAHQIALRQVYGMLINRQTVSVTIPPSYQWLVEGDRVQLDVAGTVFQILISEVSRGVNGVIAIKGRVENQRVASQLGINGDANPTLVSVQDPGFVQFYALDVPPLSDDHAGTPGFYYAVALVDQTAAFLGATIYRTVIKNPGATADGLLESDFVLDTFVASEATVGLIRAGDAASGPGETSTSRDHLLDAVQGYTDLVGSVNVTLFNGALISVTELELFNGANRCVVGSEIIQFKTATLEEDGTYTLTSLLRGRGGTFPYEHLERNEQFALLDLTAIEFHPVDDTGIGAVHSFRAVPAGVALGDTPLVEATTFLGNTARPKPVMHIQALGDTFEGSPSYHRSIRSLTIQSNVLILWSKQNLENTSAFRNFEPDGATTILPEDEFYRIEIFDPASPSTLLRVYKTLNPFFVYTGSLQVADGIVSAGAIPIKVSHVHTVHGASEPTSAEV